MSEPSDPEVRAVIAMIEKRSAESRRRIYVIAEILRELINRPAEEGEESELAFTLVLAERAAS